MDSSPRVGIGPRCAAIIAAAGLSVAGFLAVGGVDGANGLGWGAEALPASSEKPTDDAATSQAVMGSAEIPGSSSPALSSEGPPADLQVATPPTDGTGPALQTPTEALDAAIACGGDLAQGPDPVLLVHGTTSTVRATYEWSWVPTLNAEGRSWCTVELPDDGLADIQTSAEYVTHAIRTMHATAGRKVDVVGHSQGGMLPRWSTKWWPDTRAMVDDLVGIAPSNQGTHMVYPVCATIGCADSLRQQAPSSNFIGALNADQMTFPSINYTTINTRFDELVLPYGNGFLPEADNVSNLTVQNYCSNEPIEHFLAIVSNPVWVLTRQALDATGPNHNPTIAPGDCLKLMPGISRAKLPRDIYVALEQSARVTLFGPRSAAEPELREYARE